MQTLGQAKKAIEIHEQLNRTFELLIAANRQEIRHRVDILELFGNSSNLTERAKDTWNLRTTNEIINFKDPLSDICAAVRKYNPTLIFMSFPSEIHTSDDAMKFYEIASLLFKDQCSKKDWILLEDFPDRFTAGTTTHFWGVVSSRPSTTRRVGHMS